MAKIRSNSVQFTVVQRPHMAAPSYSAGKILLSSTAIQVNATAVLEDDGASGSGPTAGAAGGVWAPGSLGGNNRRVSPQGMIQAAPHAPRDWKFGWIQLQLSEVNWAYYEGAKLQDGSALIRYDTEAVRKTSVCRDASFEGGVWYRAAKDNDKDVSLQATAGTESLPLQLTAIHGDAPTNEFALEHRNATTQAVNLLRACEIRLRFCAVLTLQKSERYDETDYVFLKHFEWAVGARYFVTPPLPPAQIWNARIAGADSCAIMDARDGPPRQEYAKFLLARSAPHCVTEASLATQRARAQESRVRTGPPP